MEAFVTLREKLGQLFIIGLAGTELTPAEELFLTTNNIGGVILMGRNAKSPEQVHALCSSIQKLRHKTSSQAPFFISIDMEGGRVARLKSPFTQWPPMGKLGQIDSPTLAFTMAMMMGKEMQAVGINLDFAPCVDVLTNPTNTAIGDRAFSSDPEMVAKISTAVVRGLMKSEVLSCAKHFPGHGNTVVDSHEELPIEDATLQKLNDIELIPFKKAIRARVDFIMMSHVLYKNIDPQYPGTLSEILTTQLLRNELRYRGLIITDDLDMKALTKNFSISEIPVRAIEAGSDILLYCNEPQVPPQALDALEKAVSQGRISMARVEESFQRIQTAKKESLLQHDPKPWSEISSLIGHGDHQKIAQAIASGQVPEGLTEHKTDKNR